MYLFILLFPWVQVFPVVTIPTTNTFHLTITCDVITNAQWYSVIVQYRGTEVQRRYAMTNTITVSNLSSDLSSYRFTMVASNVLMCWDGHSNNIPVLIPSDESAPTPLRWTTIGTEATDRLPDGPWLTLTTNSFATPPVAQQYYRTTISNWYAESYYKID